MRPILLIVLAFVVAFFVGYGATWLISPSPSAPDENLIEVPEIAEVPDDEGDEPSEALEVAFENEAQEESPKEAPEAGTEVPEEMQEELESPEEKPEEALAEEGEEHEELRPIDRCLNKVCRVNFGTVSGWISIRQGRIEHGEEIDWDRDFGQAKKVTNIEAGPRFEATVLGIGVSQGEPRAAYLSLKSGGKVVEGILALKIGNKRITLEPID